MSHSENNLEVQKRWHKGPLIEYVIGAIFVLAVMAWWGMSEMRGSQALLDDTAPAVTPIGD